MYLKIQEVIQILSISKATLYRMVSDGSFPPPTHLGKRKSRWLQTTVENWIQKVEEEQHGALNVNLNRAAMEEPQALQQAA